jgi:hypothetical protein
MTRQMNIVSTTAIRALIVAGVVSIAASQGAWASSGFTSHATVHTATLTGVAPRATFANNPVVQPPRQFPTNPGKIVGHDAVLGAIGSGAKWVGKGAYNKVISPVYKDVLAPVGGGFKTGGKAVGNAAEDVYHFVGGLF